MQNWNTRTKLSLLKKRQGLIIGITIVGAIAVSANTMQTGVPQTNIQPTGYTK